MSIPKKMRGIHRWLSIAFTLAVVANFAVMPAGNETLGQAVGGLTLLPLVGLLTTGLYLFVLPYRRGKKPPQPST